MRLTEPRIQPVKDEDLTAEQSEILDNLNEMARNLNLFRTSLNSPECMKAMMVWSNYLGSKQTNAVPMREKELIILRTSFMCKSGYEWSHHAWLGRKAGLTDNEVAALRDAAPDHVWSDRDQALINMCDELVDDHFVSDETWAAIETFFDQKQMMDAVHTSTHYQMVGKFANTFGVQIDRGITLDDGLTHLKGA